MMIAIPKIIPQGGTGLILFSRPNAATSAGGLILVGWREWLALPEFGIAWIMAKIDTGARTSALHADSIEPFEKDGETFVRFELSGEGDQAPPHEARVADRRAVRSSNGEAEIRYVIRTELGLAGLRWNAEVSLTKRDRMEVPMLVGREALAGRAMVDPGKSWLCGNLQFPKTRRRRSRPSRVRKQISGAPP